MKSLWEWIRLYNKIPGSFIDNYSIDSTKFIDSLNYSKKPEFVESTTYNNMLALPNSKVLLIVKVSIDEDKGQTNTLYYIWPNGVRQWIAAIKDN